MAPCQGKGTSYSEAPPQRPASLLCGPERLKEEGGDQSYSPGAQQPPHCGTEQTTPGSRPCPSVSGHLLSQRHLDISLQALRESCASPMSDQVFRSPRPHLFQRWTQAEPSPGSPGQCLPCRSTLRMGGESVLPCRGAFPRTWCLQRFHHLCASLLASSGPPSTVRK